MGDARDVTVVSPAGMRERGPNERCLVDKLPSRTKGPPGCSGGFFFCALTAGVRSWDADDRSRDGCEPRAVGDERSRRADSRGAARRVNR